MNWKRGFGRLIFGASLLCVLPKPAFTQYMRIVTDNAVDSTRLNPSGTTVLTIILDTNHDRDGSLRICNSHTEGCGGRTTAQPLNMFGYAIIMTAVGGEVSWGTFTPADPAYTALQPQIQDSHDVEFVFQRSAGTFSPAGVNPLGTISVTLVSGAPRVDIVRSIALDPFAPPTNFNTQCGGFFFPNSYVLGNPADPCNDPLGAGDWFDTDGVGAPELPPGISAPESLVKPEGSSVTIEAIATDPNMNDHPTITASGYPASLTYSAAGSGSTAIGTVTGILGFSDGGTYQILWEATDESGASSTATTSLEVPEINRPPIIYAPSSVSGLENDLMTITVAAEEPDDNEPIDSFTADLSDLPPGNNAVFTTSPNHEEGTLTWTPTLSNAGTYRVIFTASNSLTGRDTTIVNVTNGEARLRLQMPGPGYRVELAVLDESCPIVCSSVYFAGDSGQVYVPLYFCGPGANCQYSSTVAIDFPAWTPAAFVSTSSLAQSLVLHPAANTADRIWNYTVPADPWIVTTFSYFSKVQPFFNQTFGIARGSLRLNLFTEAEYNSTGSDHKDIGYGDDYISWPHYASYFSTAPTYPAAWVAAHEYTHAIQYLVYGQPATCLQESGDCLIDEIFGDWWCVQCATHFGCDPTGRKGGWTEGMADALGEMFYRAKIDPAGADPLELCSPTGPDKENSIAAFVFAVAQRDPRAFMDTFRYATLTYTGEHTDHAKTVNIFHSMWRDEDPSVGFIVSHHPGTWNITALYNSLIYGTTTAVEIDEKVPPGAPEFRTSPNPVSGSLSIEGRNWPEGAELALYNVRGQCVRSVRGIVSASGIVQSRLSTDGLPTGMYFLRLRSSSGKDLGPRRKIVIVR